VCIMYVLPFWRNKDIYPYICRRTPTVVPLSVAVFVGRGRVNQIDRGQRKIKPLGVAVFADEAVRVAAVVVVPAVVSAGQDADASLAAGIVVRLAAHPHLIVHVVVHERRVAIGHVRPPAIITAQ